MCCVPCQEGKFSGHYIMNTRKGLIVKPAEEPVPASLPFEMKERSCQILLDRVRVHVESWKC